MPSDLLWPRVLAALALACALILATSGSRVLLGLALAATLALVVSIAPEPAISGLDSLETLVPGLCLVLLAHRAGRGLRAAPGSLPLAVLILAAAGCVTLLPLFAAGLAETWPGALGSLANATEPTLWTMGLLLALPDGPSLGEGHARSRAGDEALKGLLAGFALASLHAFGALRRPGSAPPEPLPAVAHWPLPQLGAVAVAIAFGLAGGWCLAQASRSVRGETRRGVARLLGALGPGAIAEALQPGTAAIAAFASGLFDRPETFEGQASTRANPDSGSATETRLPDATGRASDRGEGLAWVLPLAFLAVLAGLAWRRGPGSLSADLASGVSLWGLAFAVRVLVVFSVAGAYRALGPERVPWTRLAANAVCSAPGALALAWTLFFLGSSPDLLGPACAAIGLALLVEGSLAPWCRDRLRRSSADETWSLARGRLRALRIARDTILRWEERGDLAGVPDALRAQISREVEHERVRTELELEELLHAHARLRSRESRAVTDELAQSILDRLEREVRSGWLSAATLEALRPQVLRWFRSSSSEAPR